MDLGPEGVENLLAVELVAGVERPQFDETGAGPSTGTLPTDPPERPERGARQ
jgi:hypothetical protein